MINVYWLAFGLLLLLLALTRSKSYLNKLKGLPSAAVSFGKVWGRTTDKRVVLRSLNTYFYITGMVVTILALSFWSYEIIRPSSVQVTEIQTIKHDDVLSSTEILRLINANRELAELNTLNVDTRLNAIAQKRLDDMVANQYYAHKNLSGKYYYDLFPLQNMKADFSCENLNIDFSIDEKSHVNNWLNSTQGHRECLLNPRVKSMGIATGVYGSTGGTKIYLVVAIHSTSISDIN